MKFLYRISLSLLSAVLLSLAWPVGGFSPLLFIGFIPIFFLGENIIEHETRRKGTKFFFYSWVCFILWNVADTYWVYFSTDVGGILAFFFNSLFMAIVMQSLFITRKRLGKIWSYIALVACWTSFEMLHLSWQLSWPWLTLGNGFAATTSWVQWYEYTGVLGGTIWIWTINILLFFTIKSCINVGTKDKKSIKLGSVSGILIFIPIIFSIIVYHAYTEKKNGVNIVVVQPNIDPYNEKFSGNNLEQLQKMLDLASQKVDSTTDYLIFPETALQEGICENALDSSRSLRMLQSFRSDYPRLKIITGISSFKKFPPDHKPSETAKWGTDSSYYYDIYNAAVQIDEQNKFTVYHKSKLVPGVEKLPYPAIFGSLEKYAISLGGMSGSYGIQENRTPFSSAKTKNKIAPAICYESIYGDFMSGYMTNDADLICIMTNDGWWRDSPGYKQHCIYGSLLAIEFRRSIARSANTGISCFINQRGDISQKTNWWVPAVIKETINANDTVTFYARHGDFFGWIMFLTATILIILALLKRIFNK